MTSVFGIFVLLFFTIINLSSEAAKEEFQSLFSRSNSKFASDFYSTTILNEPNKNIVISPFSVHICGALLFSGAGEKTAEELARGLRLNQNNSRLAVATDFNTALKSHAEYKFLTIANKIYVANQIKVKEKFHQIATRAFFSEDENVDFSKSEETAEKINNWVKNATRNKIKKLFANDAFDASELMALVNTIYFKGEWTLPFEVIKTYDFWTSLNDSIQVDMMFQIDDYNIGYFPELDARIVELEYTNTDISMLIILPNKRTGLEELEQNLSGVDLINLRKKLEEGYVEIALPKFNIEFSADLKQIFTKMGMGSIFVEPDFSKMLEETRVKVDKAMHKAFIAVTELGTEAGAASSFSSHFLTKPELFVADHPFMFAIVSKSAILFLGRYVN